MYTKTEWINGQAPGISAEKLNKIEDGIFNSYKRYAYAKLPVGETVDPFDTSDNIPFTELISQSFNFSSFFNEARDEFDVPETGNYRVRATVTSSDGNGPVPVSIYYDGDIIEDLNVETIFGTYVVETPAYPMQAGAPIAIRFGVDGDPPPSEVALIGIRTTLYIERLA